MRTVSGPFSESGLDMMRHGWYNYKHHNNTEKENTYDY